MILSGCGWFGFSMANAHRKLENGLRQLVRGLEWMEWELQFRQTPLPQLCSHTGNILSGELSRVFFQMERELDTGEYGQASDCMNHILVDHPRIPERIRELLTETGRCMGQFDLNGQLSSLRSVRKECETEVNQLSRDRENRLRSYQTLGLCTGAALAVLLL